MDIAWENAEENKRRAETAIRHSAHSDIYVLPEMFTTGFCVQPEKTAEEFDPQNDSLTPTLQWMRRIAKETDSAITGSIIVKEKTDILCPDNGRERYKYFNRLFFVYPDNTYSYYDKRHLFTYGEENKHYTQGQDRVVIKFRGIRLLLQICYDLRFPVWSRNRNDYDMIIYVANWPTSRINVWNVLLRARAIENQCYVAGANRVGNDPACEYNGQSCIISPYGKIIGECPSDSEGTATADIDIEKQEAFRQKFPVISDRDRFIIQ